MTAYHPADTSEGTAIDGLHWEANQADTFDSTVLVSSSERPPVCDIATHQRHFTCQGYSLHAGQIERLTFFGPAGQLIRGDFIDCRRDSPTRHQRISLVFEPSTQRKLVIERGIAYLFSNMGNIVVRNEPIRPEGRQRATRTAMTFPLAALDAELPVLAIPRAAPPSKQSSDPTASASAPRGVRPAYARQPSTETSQHAVLEPLAWSMPPGHPRPCTIPSRASGVFWTPSLFAAAGPDSYHLALSPLVEEVDFIAPAQQATPVLTRWHNDHRDCLLTFFGQATVELLLRSEHPPIVLRFNADPLHSLHVPAGVEVILNSTGFTLVRREILQSQQDSESPCPDALSASTC
ncbi:hypothetical protein [Chitinimonas lacunae]|uniref:Uncharacterized protein n=1 Tax=Chitinimonas lacunae TaxID=1963018 RepID=A0ABV8MXM7_9NEIS